MHSDRIDDNHMGEIWPAAHPAADANAYGSVDLSPRGAFEVRSLQTFRLVYTAGPYGIDDTGALRVLFRFPTDWGRLQTRDPAGENYVTAVAANGVALGVAYAEDALPRPRYHGLTVTLLNGYMRQGDTLTITFGDPAGGSPGLRLQSFCESHFEFKVAVDVYATGHFTPIRNSPTIRIKAAAPVGWKAVAPTRRRRPGWQCRQRTGQCVGCDHHPRRFGDRPARPIGGWWRWRRRQQRIVQPHGLQIGQRHDSGQRERQSGRRRDPGRIGCFGDRAA